MTRRRFPRTKVPFPQRRQRELAWLLYISQGYVTNLEHALAVNCITATAQDIIRLRSLITQVSTHCARLRLELDRIAP